MRGHVAKRTRSGWRLWALGAAVSTACAAFLLLRRKRSAPRGTLDPYVHCWRQIRANGDHNPHLFV
jgi:hypothetical protein